MRRLTMAVAAAFLAATTARADVIEVSRTYVDIVPAQDISPAMFGTLPGQVLGSGAPVAAHHEYALLIGFRATAPVGGFTVSGSILDIRHIAGGGRADFPTYLSQGFAADFFVHFALAAAPASLSPADVGAAVLAATPLATAATGNGLPLGTSMQALPPEFSVDLGPAAVAAANAAFAAGRTFFLAVTGEGSRGPTSDSGLQARLGELAVAPEPASWVLLGMGAAGVVVVGRRRRREG